MYNEYMENKINASEIQRKGLKRVYETIDDYSSFLIVNNRQKNNLYLTKYRMNLGEVIQIIRRYKNELEKIGVKHINIFGSMAHGKATSSSDIDVSFSMNKKEGYGLKQLIKDTNNIKNLLKNEIPDIDLHNEDNLKHVIREDIKITGINVF